MVGGYIVCTFSNHTRFHIHTYFEKVFIEGIDASSKTTHPASPLASLNVYHISLQWDIEEELVSIILTYCRS